MNRPSLSKRLAAAFVITSATGGLAFGLLGLAAAGPSAAADESATHPGTFSLPARRVGDHADYVWDAGWGKLRLGLEWLPDNTSYGSDGYLRDAGILQLTYDSSEWNATLQESYDLRTLAPLSATSWASYEGQLSYQWLPPLPMAYQFDSDFAFSFTSYHGGRAASPGIAPCGVLNPLQGHTVNLGGVAFTLANCYLGRVAVAGYDFRFEGIDFVDGQETYRFVRRSTSQDAGAFQATGHRTYDAVRGDTVTLWLQPNIPYPLRLSVEGAGEIRLESFSEGTTPQGPGSAPHDPLPPLEYAPREIWGPSEDGVEHPFPLSVAFQRARDDAHYSGLRDLLAAHPNAAAVYASYSESDASAQTVHEWRFGVSDGDTVLCVDSEQKIERPTDYLLPGAPIPFSTTSHTARSCQQSYPPLPDSLPDQVPTAASLLRRWQAYSADGAKANGWGFDLGGYDPASSGSFHASRSTAKFHPGILNLDGEWQVDQLRVENSGTGLLLSVYSTQTNMEWTTDAGTATPDAGGQAPLLKQAGTSVSNVVRWDVPSQGAMLAASAAAACAGLAAWFWPAVRGSLLLPLFSRLQRPRALDHQLRSDIVALVQAHPGVHVLEICRRISQPRGTVQHHIRKLEETGILVTHAAHGFVCCYLQGTSNSGEAEVQALLKSEGARRVLAAVVAQPGRSASEIAEQLGLTRQTLHHHVGRLAEARLVRVQELPGRVLKLLPGDDAALRLERAAA